MQVIPDPFNLQRFVDAQSSTYMEALQELRAGAKRTHWMWFIFPQLRGLGASATSGFYGIGSAAEARAYLAHPVLGPRIKECCQTLLQIQGHSAEAIMGYPDHLKLRSSATLFSLVSADDPVFSNLLIKYFGGEPDPKTVLLLRAADRTS